MRQRRTPELIGFRGALAGLVAGTMIWVGLLAIILGVV